MEIKENVMIVLISSMMMMMIFAVVVVVEREIQTEKNEYQHIEHEHEFHRLYSKLKVDVEKNGKLHMEYSYDERNNLDC